MGTGMVVMRPAVVADAPGLVELLRSVGTALTGMSSLQADTDSLAHRIERSEADLARAVEEPSDEDYVFVAVDGDDVIGMSGLVAGVGLDSTFYSYRLGLLVKSSRELGVYSRIETLYLNSDLTGSSELCSLFVGASGRSTGAGRLLSLARLVFVSGQRGRVGDRMIAEMRGVSDPDGTSPFWQGLGRHFFGMDFADADRIYAQGNRTFLAELLPEYPVYVPLLPESAREAIGEVHDRTRPARAMLEAQGMAFEGYLDPFDGGPTLSGATDRLATVASARSSRVCVALDVDGGDPWLVARPGAAEFRCVMVPALVTQDEVTLSAVAAAGLGVVDGDTVVVAPARLRPVALRSDRLGDRVTVTPREEVADGPPIEDPT